MPTEGSPLYRGKPRVSLCLRYPWVYLTEHYYLIHRTSTCWPNSSPNRYDRFGWSKLLRNSFRAHKGDKINYCCTIVKPLRTLHTQVTETWGINQLGSHYQLMSCLAVWFWHQPNHVMTAKTFDPLLCNHKAFSFLKEIQDTGLIA